MIIGGNRVLETATSVQSRTKRAENSLAVISDSWLLFSIIPTNKMAYSVLTMVIKTFFLIIFFSACHSLDKIFPLFQALSFIFYHLFQDVLVS